MFDTVIPQANQFAEAAEYGPRATLKQKWGYGGLADTYKALTREVLLELEG